MQASAFGVNWAQYAWALAGCALVVGALLGLLQSKKLQREARRERPPQKEKLLRPAGYSAMCRLEDLTDKLFPALVQALVAGAVLGLTAGGFFYPVLEGLARGRFTAGQIWHALAGGPLIAPALLALAAAGWAISKIRLA